MTNDNDEYQRMPVYMPSRLNFNINPQTFYFYVESNPVDAGCHVSDHCLLGYLFQS